MSAPKGDLPNADATVNFACKRPKYADTVGKGVSKRSNFADVHYDGPCFLTEDYDYSVLVGLLSSLKPTTSNKGSTFILSN